jgi:hypothetical protein
MKPRKKGGIGPQISCQAVYSLVIPVLLFLYIRYF